MDALLEPFRSRDIQVALGINILLAWSFYLTVITGQLSLGHAAFMAIGAYAASVITVKLQLPLIIAIPSAAIAAALAGVFFGWPALRLKGLYLAIASLGLVFLVSTGLENWPYVGGRLGMSGMTGADVGLTWLTVLAIGTLLWWFDRSRLAVAMRAVREHEVAAASQGVGITVMKVLGFAAGAAIAGIAGGIWAHYIIFIEPRHFDIIRSFDIVLFVVFGGIGVFWGPMLGAALMTLLPVWVRPMADWREVIFAVLLILLMALRPEGLVSGPRIRRTTRKSIPGARPLPAPRHLAAAGQVLLEVNGLSKRFGGLQALHKVAFEMRAGEILGVIGPNGAGKSTLFNCVTGFVKPDEGSVRLAGHELVHLPPQHIARCGLSRSFQNGGLIASFSARDNVLLGQHLRLASPLAMLRPIGLGLEERSLLSEADALLGRAGLGARVGLPASALAYGEQRRLEIVRALAARPSVLMLDEPAAGMIEEEVNDLSILLRSLAGDGLSIVIVEHNVGFVANLCNRIVALDLGRVIASGPPAAVIRDRAVVAAYLGA